MSPHEYVTEVANRLTADGVDVSTVNFRNLPAVVGYRSEFRLSWMAGRMHLFTVVGAVQLVTAAGLEQFTNDAIDYALSKKGELRGLQSGVAAIPVLVGEHVDPEAVAYTQTAPGRRFAAMGWPVAVDTTTRQVHTFEGRVVLGAVFARWLRQQIAVALPEARTS